MKTIISISVIIFSAICLADVCRLCNGRGWRMVDVRCPSCDGRGYTGGDWRPNWEEDTIKYSILSSRNRLLEYTPSTTSHILSFPTAEMRNDFFDTFRDLIEQAKMFL